MSDEFSNKRLRSPSDTQQEQSLQDTTATAQELPALKKAKTTDVIFHNADGFPQRLRTAFDLQKALQWRSLCDIRNIGYSPAVYEEKRPPKAFQKTILKDLRDLYKETPRPHKMGQFEDFPLTITRPNCEFKGTAMEEMQDSDLERWFKGAAISGYGDNLALETKVNPDVRDAREIPSSEFSVTQDLLELINSTFEENLMPSGSRVRAEPYKIHLYGPGGHFKSHRDTPEPGLVGTFLLGLGDTTSAYDRRSGKGGFKIGEETVWADPCHWVAFYPDVPHSISKLPDDAYRGVVAFKIFSDGADTDLVAARDLEFQSRVEMVLHSIPRPFGILLDHCYHLGVAELTGYDTTLLASVKTRDGSIIHVLPVVIETDSEEYYDDLYGYPNRCEGFHGSEPSDFRGRSYYKAPIKPFLPAHVDILNGRSTPTAQAAIKFLEDLREVPFYRHDFKESGLWTENKDEINFTGNESDGKRESSIYLQHALLVLRADGGSDDVPAELEESEEDKEGSGEEE